MAVRAGFASRGTERELATLVARLDQLASFFHRRWSAPVLAELHHCHRIPGPGGAKFITLVKRLGVNRESLRATLDHLIALDLVMPNPGYGHPMRPEYLLTPEGLRRTGPCAAFMNMVAEMKLEAVALRKWPMPVLYALWRGPGRFGALRALLGAGRRAGAGVTARALTLALKDLMAAGLVEREVIDAFPPLPIYRATAKGANLARLVMEV